jgi:transaldolase
MNPNRVRQLAELGQTVWYDFIRRDLYQGPELRRLIEEDGLQGMTSNPTIFQKAIASSQLYDEDIRRMGAAGKSPPEIFEALAVADVCGAADAFRPLFERSKGQSGFVSIEVQPGLAGDTGGTVAEARRLWGACGRPNIMVKIPATAAGVPAIRECLAEGININITLLFSVARYRQVMDAYLDAVEERLAAHNTVDGLRSVASFFVSRVDTLADARLDALAKAGNDQARALRGKLAIANARVAYQAFEEVFGGQRFAAMKGANRQQPLWASTSTKDPAYPKLYYVEALVAPDTVDTMPPETFQEYLDHGDPRIRIRDDLAGARAVFPALARVGIDVDEVTRTLEQDGVEKFTQSYESVIAAVVKKVSGGS